MDSAERVTAADVARRLGVSRSTVSRAFTPEAVINPETRARILKTAATLGYQPNAFAQALISRRSRIVGIIMGELHNPFHATMHSALTAELQRAGLATVTTQVSPGGGIDDAVTMLRSYQVDAALMTSMHVTSDMVRRCQRAGLRLALINRIDADGIAASVCADLEQGGRLAARTLFEAGSRRIAVIGGQAGSWTADARRAGHLAGLADAGLRPVADLPGDYTYDAGQAAAEALFSDGGPRPDGVLCANDLTAIGLIDGARRRFGLTAPTDYRVVGFDDIPMCAWDAYDLTTVRLPVNRMAARSVDLVARFITEPGFEPERTFVPCKIMVRGSTGGGDGR